jgi:hypothetical protein
MLLAGIQKKNLDARPSLRWGRLFAGMTIGYRTLIGPRFGDEASEGAQKVRFCHFERSEAKREICKINYSSRTDFSPSARNDAY